jgi:hypothetical protein
LGAGSVELPRNVAWEVLLDQPGGPSDTIEVATTGAAFTHSWSTRYPGLAVPSTRFPRPLYVFFSIVVSANCLDAVMSGLTVDRSASLVYGTFARNTGGATSCSDVAGAHTFVVAIDRGALPTGRLTVRLEHDFAVCSDCGREREQVEIDL